MDDSKWMTPQELFERYDIKLSTQSNLRMKKKIPFSKIGKTLIRYNIDKIDKWLADAEVKNEKLSN